jgi:hypothetical protein
VSFFFYYKKRKKGQQSFFFFSRWGPILYFSFLVVWLLLLLLLFNNAFNGNSRMSNATVTKTFGELPNFLEFARAAGWSIKQLRRERVSNDFRFLDFFFFFLVFGDDDQIHLNSKKLIYNMNILISFSLVSDDGGMNPPINLPASLESLPRAEHFPTQRHRWNTNEVFLSFLKKIKTYNSSSSSSSRRPNLHFNSPFKTLLGNSIIVDGVLMTY